MKWMARRSERTKRMNERRRRRRRRQYIISFNMYSLQILGITTPWLIYTRSITTHRAHCTGTFIGLVAVCTLRAYHTKVKCLHMKYLFCSLAFCIFFLRYYFACTCVCGDCSCCWLHCANRSIFVHSQRLVKLTNIPCYFHLYVRAPCFIHTCSRSRAYRLRLP